MPFCTHPQPLKQLTLQRTTDDVGLTHHTGKQCPLKVMEDCGHASKIRDTVALGVVAPARLACRISLIPEHTD